MTIFGYTWDEIKRAQQGGDWRANTSRDLQTARKPGDWELLERYGEAELRNRGYSECLIGWKTRGWRTTCRTATARRAATILCGRDNPDCPSLRPNVEVTG